jgi:predicted GNAT superfamily acetyltransferase
MNALQSMGTVVEIDSADRCHELARVLADVWSLPDSTGVAAPDLLRALAFSGGYVVGVERQGHLVGGGVGWPSHALLHSDIVAGTTASPRSEWRLHSHVVGFVAGHRSMGLGALTKRHQREWARERGFAAVEWTFDPLRMANARFNLNKLGAEVLSFHHDFYGEIDDVFNAGLGSDRFLVRWAVDDIEPGGGRLPLPEDRQQILSSAADGSPVIADAATAYVAAQIPADIVAIRTQNIALAMAWRDAFRTTVGRAVAEGAHVRAINNRGEYLIDL